MEPESPVQTVQTQSASGPHRRIWPVLVSLGSAGIMLVSFFIPSVQDQWDRFQSRKVIERYVAIGDAFSSEERFDMAEKAYEKAFELSDNARLDIEVKRLNAKINRVTMEPYWGNKPSEEIEEIDFQYVLHMVSGEKQRKERVLALNSYGVYLASYRRSAESEKAFREAMRLDPRDILSHVNLGNLFDATGRKDSAAVYYRRAIAIDSANSRAHYNLGLLLCETGDLNEAREHLSLAVKNDPSDTDAVRELRLVDEERARDMSAPHPAGAKSTDASR